MNETKYLLDGSAVEVLEALPSGKFLVARFYETLYHGEADMESDHSRPEIVERLYDSAPTQAMDVRIKEAQVRLDALKAQRLDVVNKLCAAQAGEREIEMKLKRHAQLSRLLDFIDGKITYYVEDDWQLPRIIEFKDSTTPDDERERPERRRLRLLSLFGDSKGDLEWNLNRYRDGSGLNTLVYPCCSYEEAMAKVTELFAVRFREQPRADVVERADKFGIPVPAEYRAACVAMARKNLESRAQTLRAELEGIDEKLGALK